MSARTAPRDCPVCATTLALTRLSCPECRTELSGDFAACDFCGLAADDRQTLRVFLASRGNMKELERHLGVSYPTARARFDALLVRLGIEAAPPAPSAARVELLQKLAAGEVGVDEVLGEF